MWMGFFHIHTSWLQKLAIYKQNQAGRCLKKVWLFRSDGVNSQRYRMVGHMLGIIQRGSLGYVSFQIPLRYPTPFFSPTSFVCRLLSFAVTWSCFQEGITYTLLPLTTLKNPFSKINAFVINHVAFTTSHSRTQPSWCKRDGRTCDCPSCMPCRILHGYGTLRLGKWDIVHVGYVYTYIYIYIHIWNILQYGIPNVFRSSINNIRNTSFSVFLRDLKPAFQAFMSHIKTQIACQFCHETQTDLHVRRFHHHPFRAAICFRNCCIIISRYG